MTLRRVVRVSAFFGVVVLALLALLRNNGNLDAVDQETLALVQRHKLGRYSLFESRSNGGAQSSNVWYQENAEPAYTCLLEERIGPDGDGGKWVCDPEKLRHSTECIVYSVGSNNDFRFEEAILKDISSSCEVHVFDHTVTDPKNVPPGVNFHPWGLAAVSDPSNSMYTLHDILERLDHVGKVIDIFKIDCEGCEWTTYATWLDSKNGVLIDEILVEVHAGTTEPALNPVAKQFMQSLFDHNFLIFHKEPNVQYTSGDGLCLEYAFKRVSNTAMRAVNAG